MGKSKLPKGISYPVKRMEFEKALGAEVLDGVEVVFRDSPTSSNHYVYELLNWHDPIKVVRVSFHKHEYGYSAPREGSDQMKFTGEQESIHIYPVRSSDRAHAHSALMTEGVRLIKAWLEKDRPETWRTGRHFLELWWDPFSKAFEIKSE